jgi:Methyltransferase FkbM domain
MNTLDAVKKRSRWLNEHAKNVYSHGGEDGIVAKVLSMVPKPTGWCVEFGAWDGRHLSNTFNLVANHNYQVILIEADHKKFSELKASYPYSDRAIFINALVGFTPDTNLDSFLRTHPIPQDFDLLSIDIDGNDYHAWEAIQAFRPRFVLIEFNPTIANTVHFVQSRDLAITQGASAAALISLAKRKGYELIAVTPWNLLFTTSELFGLFDIADNSLPAMREDNEVPHVFVGHDGHVFLRDAGACGLHLPWHGLLLPESAVQLLPKRLQKYPERYTNFEKWLYRCWRPRRVRRAVMHCWDVFKRLSRRLV